MADLIGAGLGALLAVPVMDAIGPINSILASVVIFCVAALVIYPGGKLFLRGAFVLLALIVFGSNVSLRWLSLDMASVPGDKPIQESLASGGKVVQTLWDSFARTDLVQTADGGPYRIYLDGAAGSVMPSAANNDFLLRDIGFFPFATSQPKRVLIIGPGAGLDVWFGLQSRASEIVAVEVNPGSVALVTNYGAYNGDLYRHPEVRVVVDEGRSVLRREDTRYDLIFLSQVVTLAAERTGYALTENTVYTVEAFRDYLAHLNPDGQIALKLYDEITLTRALSTVLAAFREQGLSDADALAHTAAFLDQSSDSPIPLLMIRSTPFTRDDSLVYGSIARQVGFRPLFLPGVLAEPPLDTVQDGRQTFTSIVETSQADISPTTDDHPFFYQVERGIPNSLTPLLLGVVTATVVIGGVLVFTQRRSTPASLRWMPLYFAGLGIGFMMVEIALIQQTRLFIGPPTLAVTVVLAVLLIGGGIGSRLSELWIAPQVLSALPGMVVVVLLAAWMLLWPLLSQNFVGLPLVLRVGITTACLTPLALFMGMLFPIGLRFVGQIGDEQAALAWTLNGLTTVMGSVGAVTLASVIGFNSVLVVSITAYAFVSVYSYLVHVPET
jgi:hypothetical protein